MRGERKVSAAMAALARLEHDAPRGRCGEVHCAMRAGCAPSTDSGRAESVARRVPCSVSSSSRATSYARDAGSSPASTCSTSAARTVSSIDASRTKPECNRSNSRSDIESRSTPPTRSSTRGRCNQRKRTSASRAEVTARSRKPRSISASLGGSRLRRVARAHVEKRELRDTAAEVRRHEPYPDEPSVSEG
jgi:hypothetical protein